MFRFEEHAVVLPVVVVSELEAKRNDPEIGYFARQALRNLDDLRIQHERLDFPIPIGDGGSLRVELNHSSQSVLPSGLQSGDNDSRILAVALSLSNDGLPVTVVSKDLPLRVKAASIGLAAEEYRAEFAPQSGWTGIAEIELSADDMARLYDTDRLSSRLVGDLPVNTGLVIHSDRGSALGRVVGRGELRLVRADRDVFGLHGRSAEQRHSDRPAPRPGDRHRLARRTRRNRQVRAGPLRGARGGARAAAVPQDHGLPSALRGRRPGTRTFCPGTPGRR